MASGDFEDFNVALKTRDIFEKIAANVVKKLRPADRYAQIVSIDYSTLTANVQLAGDDGLLAVKFPPSQQPRTEGTIVQVSGKPGNYYITNLLSEASMHAVYEVTDEVANAALNLASEKNQVFVQPNMPDTLGPADVNDIWYDTDDNNKAYRWDGTSWILFKLPPGSSDGLAPPQVQNVSIQGGIKSVGVTWDLVTNPDFVTYFVYAGTVAGYARDTNHLLGRINGSSFVTSKIYDEGLGVLRDMVAEEIYRFEVVAVDADGPGAVSADAFGGPAQINTPDIAAQSIVGDHILGNTITADKFAVTLIMALKIILGDRITMSDTEGIQIRTNSGTISFPTNGDSASIAADLIAFSLTVMNSLNVRGVDNYLSGTMNVSSGVLDPNAAPIMANYWASEPGFYNGGVIRTYSGYASGIAPGAVTDELYSVYFTTGPTLVKIYSAKPGLSETVVATFDETVIGVGYKPTSQGGFFKDANGKYWLLCVNATGSTYLFKMVRFSASFVKETEWAFTCAGIASYTYPVAGFDINVGASPNYGIVIAWQNGGYTKFQAYTQAGVKTGAEKSYYWGTSTTPEYVDGSFAGYYNAVIGRNLLAFNFADATRETTRDFGVPPHADTGTYHRWGRSSSTVESYVKRDSNNVLWRYINNMVASTPYGKYTYYDADPAGTYGAGTESKPSPAKMLNRAPGAMIRMDISAPPYQGSSDDPNTARMYLSDDGTTYKLQGTFVTGQTSASISTVIAGAAPPTLSGFAGRTAAAVGRLKSIASDLVGPLWDFKGDGPGRAGYNRWDATGRVIPMIEAVVRSTFYLNPGFNSLDDAYFWTETYDPLNMMTSGGGIITIPENGVYTVVFSGPVIGSYTDGRRIYQVERYAVGAAIPASDVSGTIWGRAQTGAGVAVNLTFVRESYFVAGEKLRFLIYHNYTYSELCPVNTEGDLYVTVRRCG